MFVSREEKRKTMQKKIPQPKGMEGKIPICHITISILWEFVFFLLKLQSNDPWTLRLEFHLLFSPSGATQNLFWFS